MAQITITELPQAQALTGTEAVPIVQNGVTVQTTSSAIAGAGALNYPFLTVGSTVGLTNARQIAAGSGLSLTDNGAGSTLQINLTGAALSLNSSPTGIQVKTGSNTLTGRTLAVNAGLTITNGDGVAGDPTIGLGAVLSNVAALTGTGILATASGTFSPVTLTGVSGQISITNGTGSGGNPTFGLSASGVVAGTYGSGSIVPVFVADTYGRLTSVTDTAISISALQITSDTLGIARGGTNAGTANGALTNLLPNQTGNNGRVLATDGTLTYWQAVGGVGTVTQINTGTGLTGGPITGTGTISIDSTVATLTGTQTLTNKTISGASNTLTNIANASLTNSSVTVGTTAIALGASSLTLGGLTTVTVTQDPTAALDLATKQYVDAVAQGLDPKASCVAATTANITLSGTQTIDGVALIAGDRCLVKDQTLSQNNGIYLVAAGAWTRATDMDSWAEVPGAFTFIEQGTTWADTGWVCTSNAGGTLGTTPITWVQFAGAGSYTAGTGLTLTGTQFSLTVPVTVALGGTNATNATDARTNLVAAKSGTNSDITELYALNGTSYGVAYQNLANQLVMGAVLTFDGTTLTAPSGAFSTISASGVITSTIVTGTAPFTVASTTQVANLNAATAGTATNATNATNTAITANSTNATNYLTFVSATTGNLGQLVNSSITCNPSTGQITGGVAGGAF